MARQVCASGSRHLSRRDVHKNRAIWGVGAGGGGLANRPWVEVHGYVPGWLSRYGHGCCGRDGAGRDGRGGGGKGGQPSPVLLTTLLSGRAPPEACTSAGVRSAGPSWQACDLVPAHRFCRNQVEMYTKLNDEYQSEKQDFLSKIAEFDSAKSAGSASMSDIHTEQVCVGGWGGGGGCCLRSRGLRFAFADCQSTAVATPLPFRSPELPECAGTFCRNVVIL